MANHKDDCNGYTPEVAPVGSKRMRDSSPTIETFNPPAKRPLLNYPSSEVADSCESSVLYPKSEGNEKASAAVSSSFAESESSFHFPDLIPEAENSCKEDSFKFAVIERKFSPESAGYCKPSETEGNFGENNNFAFSESASYWNPSEEEGNFRETASSPESFQSRSSSQSSSSSSCCHSPESKRKCPFKYRKAFEEKILRNLRLSNGDESGPSSSQGSTCLKDEYVDEMSELYIDPPPNKKLKISFDD